MTLEEIIEAGLDQLAARRESPEAFEALFWCLYRWRQDSPENVNPSCELTGL